MMDPSSSHIFIKAYSPFSSSLMPASAHNIFRFYIASLLFWGVNHQILAVKGQEPQQQQFEPPSSSSSSLVFMEPMADWSNNHQYTGHHHRTQQNVPDMSPMAVWRRHHQQLQHHNLQQQRQWAAHHQMQAVHQQQPMMTKKLSQNAGHDIGGQKSPFEGVPPFRSLYQQPKKGGGMKRLLMAGSAEDELPSNKLPQHSQFVPSDPSANNLDRYMPLLARHRPRPKNTTTHWSLANSAEIGEEARQEEERMTEELDEEDAEGGEEPPQPGAGPCVSAKCRTWITITIPSELVGGIGTGSEQVGGKPEVKIGPTQSSRLKGPILPPSPTLKPMPPFPPSPMAPVPKSRGMPKNPNSSSTQGPLPTTRTPAPNFVFSTKWILPVNGLSIKPNMTQTSGTTPAPTTATTSGTPWIQPFTLRSRPPKSSTAQPRERPAEVGTPNAKVRPPKPWTHTTDAKKASNVPKSRPEPSNNNNSNRPLPPTTDTTIEQAAIWVSKLVKVIGVGVDQTTIHPTNTTDQSSQASTELIDAIREALAKFRASLTRQGARAQHRHQDGADQNADGENYDEDLRAQFQSAWDSIKGTWLEQAVTALAMDAVNGGAEGLPQAKVAEFLHKTGMLPAQTDDDGTGRIMKPMD